MNKGILLTALSGALYGSIGFFGIRLIEHGLVVRDVLLWRFLFSSILLLPFLPFWFPKASERAQSLKPLARLFVLGGLFYGGGTVFYFESSVLIGSGLAMVIFFVYPIIVVSFSWAFDRAPLRMITVVSLMLIIAGCGLIAFEGNAEFNLLGIAMAVMSAAGYGIYIFGSKRSSSVLHPGLATFAVCLGAATSFVFHSLISQGHVFVPTGFDIWLLITLFSLFGTILPVLLLLAGMKSLSANKASIISVLEPVTTLGVGAFILGEAVSLLQFLGALVILSSAVLIQLEKEKAVKPC